MTGAQVETECLFDGDRFVFVNETVAQPVAKTRCTDLGGTLARISNFEELNAAKDLVTTFANDNELSVVDLDFWLGKCV